jgi:hypothetical protein
MMCRIMPLKFRGFTAGNKFITLSFGLKVGVESNILTALTLSMQHLLEQSEIQLPPVLSHVADEIELWKMHASSCG